MANTRLRLTAVALFLAGDTVLLLHQMTPPEPNCWDLPGGGLEPEEDLITGLRREVREETGIQDFTVERLLTVSEGFYPEVGGQLHTVNLIYQCRVYPQPLVFTPIDREEIGPQGIHWWPIANLRRADCSSRAQAALASAGWPIPE
ncbi:MAG: NUDIX hydrolase [Cyanobacteria bacterium REEB459]|nr:NUDIX hydrolase [Cyanobacteria bacterium REEB459]